MKWFEKKDKRVLGVDIGAGGVKAVELLIEDGLYQLMSYGASERAADQVQVPLTDDPAQAIAHLKRIYSEAGMEAKQVVASLPVHAVFSSVIAIPDVASDTERRALVERQAAKLISGSLDDMVIDYQLIDASKAKAKEGKGGSAERNVRVLITGAPKALVKTYTQIFEEAGLSLISLETEPFALIRSLLGGDTNTIMLLDVGAFRTNMTIAQAGVPFVNRSIKVGGAMVTRRMAEQMGSSILEAEQMKMDLAQGGVSEVPKAVEELFLPIVNEITYAMDLHAQSGMEGSRVEKIVLTGGSAHLPGLDTFLTQQLNMRTVIGDPWARVRTHSALRTVLDELGPRYAVSIGLGMYVPLNDTPAPAANA
jgi:type IV pilus assembly protein PilM